jgi:hypothetical protein
MTVSAWEVYLLLKLDSFRDSLIVFGSFGLLIAALLVVTATQEFVTGSSRALFFLSPIVPALALLLGIILPTTKQAAVIFTAPRILTSDFVRRDVPVEVREIYGLAKQWLKEKAEEEGTMLVKPKVEGDNQ